MPGPAPPSQRQHALLQVLPMLPMYLLPICTYTCVYDIHVQGRNRQMGSIYIVKQDFGRPAVCTTIYIPTDRRLSKILLYYVYATHLPVTTLHMCVNHTPANYTPTSHTSHAYCCILQISHSRCIHQLCTPTMYNNPPPSTHHVRRGSM